MSLMFTLAKWMIRLSGNKKTTALPLDALCARLQGFNRSRSFSLPRDGRFRYREEKITPQMAETAFRTVTMVSI